MLNYKNYAFMETLSYFKHTKQFSDQIDEVELLFSNTRYHVRVKYASMKTSRFYEFRSSVEARYFFTKTCLFILS